MSNRCDNPASLAPEIPNSIPVPVSILPDVSRRRLMGRIFTERFGRSHRWRRNLAIPILRVDCLPRRVTVALPTWNDDTSCSHSDAKCKYERTSDLHPFLLSHFHDKHASCVVILLPSLETEPYNKQRLARRACNAPIDLFPWNSNDCLDHKASAARPNAGR